MKTTLLSVACLCMTVAGSAQIMQTSPYEAKISALMAKMTLEEKVGQMAQFNLSVIGKGKDVYSSYMPFSLDTARMNDIFGKYHAGSIINAPDNTAQTPEQWRVIQDGIRQASAKYSKIPVLYGIDGIHGATYTAGATLFPQEVAMAATFNRDLVYAGARSTAADIRASMIPWNFSPTLDLGRNPCWPRMWENYGEDAYLAAEMGIMCVKGYQGDDPQHIGKYSVGACLKHYLGYGVPVSGKDRTPAYIPDNQMREKHFETFFQAIRAGALSVMVNSGIVNGVSLHADGRLITGWLKEGLGWDGVVVTDWADIKNLYTRDHIAADDKQAIALSINAGVDMAMIPYEKSFCTELIALVKEGAVSEQRIDDAVRRILRLKFRLGLFDAQPKPTDYKPVGNPESRKIAFDAACEAITLLKNKNSLLPLKPNVKILVAGPNANSLRTLDGAWSYSWQGEKVDRFAAGWNTILSAIENRVGKANVTYVPGVEYKMDGRYDEELAPDFDAAVRAAASVDYIVVCVGENSYCETLGNLDDLNISENQQELVHRLAATGKPVILVLNEGRPRLISRVEPLVQAVVQTYLPGNMGGDALAAVLWGDVNPSGRLPYTYPKYPNALVPYDYKPAENREKMDGAYNYDAVTTVQYAFGYGLSYTTFEYSDLRVDKMNFAPGDILTFKVDVRNSGSRAGKEAVLLFISDQVASLTPDNRRLRGFVKVDLKPGESQTVTIPVAANNLAFVNEADKWVLEQGSFMVQAGSNTLQVNCTRTDADVKR